jgi:hypothetical protein
MHPNMSRIWDAQQHQQQQQQQQPPEQQQLGGRELSVMDTIEQELPQPAHILPPGGRSRPIAIRQSAVGIEGSDEFSENDDGGESDFNRTHSADRDIPQQEDNERSEYSQQRHCHQSLPNRMFLLRAPLLGSIPTNEEYMNRRSNIPEFRLSEQEDVDDEEEKATAYGSLRDSQMQGRFLDGPRSFIQQKATRSSVTKTGAVVTHRHRGVSSTASNNTLSTSAPVHSGLSIGERIQQQRKLQLALRNQSSSEGLVGSTCSTATTAITKKSSVLTEMMEKLSQDDTTKRIHYETTPPPEYGIPSLAEENTKDPVNSVAPLLSSSLTGLEILQHGLQRQDQQQQLNVVQTTTATATTGFLLSPAHTATTTNAVNSAMAIESYITSLSLEPTTTTTATANIASTSQSFRVPHPPQPLPIQNPMAMDDEEDDDAENNPDMEGAFDLDMD